MQMSSSHQACVRSDKSSDGDGEVERPHHLHGRLGRSHPVILDESFNVILETVALCAL
jgi:hypothetical protein